MIKKLLLGAKDIAVRKTLCSIDSILNPIGFSEKDLEDIRSGACLSDKDRAVIAYTETHKTPPLILKDKMRFDKEILSPREDLYLKLREYPEHIVVPVNDTTVKSLSEGNVLRANRCNPMSYKGILQDWFGYCPILGYRLDYTYVCTSTAHFKKFKEKKLPKTILVLDEDTEVNEINGEAIDILKEDISYYKGNNLMLPDVLSKYASEDTMVIALLQELNPNDIICLYKLEGDKYNKYELR